MITGIQLKQVLRNRRFLIFTILFPTSWYWMMIKLTNTPREADYQLILLILALLIGILGNSIVTFSKRIASNRNFYFLQARISRYSIWKYLISQLVTQLILNLVITIILVLLACLLQTIKFNQTTWLTLGLVNLFGIYLSVIGFTFGISFSRSSIDAGSTPLMFLLAMFIIPWNVFIPTNSMVKLMTNIQRLFPSYYAYQIVQQNDQLFKDFGLFLLSSVITLLPFLMIIAFKLNHNADNALSN
ncbi:ABC transporter permease [Limosilactobacillus sp. STM2_1]|uniref:ABC transporter permease n=1 Tax=Limosilactobacillus rudii TaxID=2759755 RepID=A0A7W3YNY6_9LACO|nr:ABC transporter permease [Limosilactobacillus rudii]MBB1079753.1 ABC transporter permease [Limosilactobacillus rudii]MBB1097787.1 ABC transporter permease [Limosilactobacillus rudii]MCD7134868.1 ABC transporter permease [Limosilactobacillus rudii]